MNEVDFEKERNDFEVNEYLQSEIEPSEKQKEYIVALAKEVGLEVDVSRLKDRKKASLLIDRLKQLNRQMNGHSNERKAAFGFATQLVFGKFVENGKDPVKYKRFWKDVRHFYEEYTKHQDIQMSKEVI